MLHLPLYKRHDIRRTQVQAMHERFWGRASRVGRQHQMGQGEQRIVRSDGLLRAHIQASSSDCSIPQSLVHRLLVHQLATRRVDQ